MFLAKHKVVGSSPTGRILDEGVIDSFSIIMYHLVARNMRLAVWGNRGKKLRFLTEGPGRL